MHKQRLFAGVVALTMSSVALLGEGRGYVVAATEGSVWETSIAVSPADPKKAVAVGAVSQRGVARMQSFYTDDGGRSWHYGGAFGLETAKYKYLRSGDPVVASDRNGVMYAVSLIGDRISYPQKYSGIVTYRSADNGRTWEGPFGVVERGPEQSPYYADDKEWISVDATGGKYDGHLYVSWIRNDTASPQTTIASVFSKSTDGGRTWSPEKVLGRGAGGQISIGPNGEVHVLRTCDGSYCSQTSLDGGETFSEPVRIARSATFLSNAVDTSSGPHRGNLYIVWIDAIGGPQLTRSFVGTVYYSRSTDGGKSWAPPTTITKIPYTALFQTIACDPVTGEVLISWLDRRANPNGKQFRLYMTRSSDGGATFSAHEPVTSAIDMTVPPGATGFIGDYNQMAGHNRVFFSAFSDGTGKLSVARIEVPEPPSGKKRRAARK